MVPSAFWAMRDSVRCSRQFSEADAILVQTRVQGLVRIVAGLLRISPCLVPTQKHMGHHTPDPENL